VPSASAVYGSPVTLSATVNPAPPNGETVTFKDGTTSLGCAPLMSGTAMLPPIATATLLPGIHVIRATYNGDGTYLASSTAIGPSSIITTVAGGGVGDGGPAANATSALASGGWDTRLFLYQGVFAVDPAGNIFIADTQNHRVREISATTGIITTVAGNGSPTYNADDIPATLAGLDPVSVAVVPAGVLGADELLVVADYGNNRIREVDLTTGLITTVAGSGIPEHPLGDGGYGDGGLATAAELFQPTDVVVDEYGHLFLVDNAGGAFVREVNLTASAVTVPSDMLLGGVLEPGWIASVTNTTFTGQLLPQNGNQIGQLNTFASSGLFMAVNPSGTDLYVARPFCTHAEVIDLVTGDIDPFSDSVPSNSDFNSYVNQYGGVYALVVDGNGNVFIGESGGLYEFNSSGQYVQQVEEQGGPVSVIQALATDAAGRLYAVTGDEGERIMESPYGTMRPLISLSGDEDGEAATNASMGPTDAMVDSSGNIFIADATNYAIREVSATTGLISAVAGIYDPTAVALDEKDDLLFIADSGNDAVREVDLSSGQITTVLTGPGPIDGVLLNSVGALAYDQDHGILYIADSADNQVLAYTPSSGDLTPVAGNAAQPAGFGGDNGPANQATLNAPGGLAVDDAGDLYIADTGNNLVCEIIDANSANPQIITVAGNYNNGVPGYYGDNRLATSALLNGPTGLALDASGDLFIADTGNNVIREVNASGTISTIAGLGTSGLGDGGGAISAQLSSPAGLSFDNAGDLLIADAGNGRVREIQSGEVITVAAGTTTSISGPASSSAVFGEQIPVTATVAWN